MYGIIFIDRMTAKQLSVRLKEEEEVKKLKTTGGSATGLHTHLRTVHSNITAVETGTPSSESTPSTSTSSTTTSQEQTKLKKRKLMTEYFRSSESMEAIVSRMTALNGSKWSKDPYSSTSKDQYPSTSKDLYPSMSKVYS